MSVVVDIEIAGGAARRQLVIFNTSETLELGVDGLRDLEQQCEYGVRSVGGSRALEARFTHRYGDDVLALIARAGEALRSEHGFV